MNETHRGTAVRTPTFSAARLRAARAGKGLTQEATAALIGRTLSTYVRYELGVLKPSWETLGPICVVLDVTVGDLIDDPRASERLDIHHGQ